MTNINITNHPIEFYIEKIKNNENFSFTRWGDGEWYCTIGMSGKNCDNHQYFPKLSEGLNVALKNNKNYYKAIWNLNHGQIKRNLNVILPYIESNNINIEWVNAGIWEEAAINGNLNTLVDALENRNFIIVSNDKLRGLDINYTDFISVPSYNCFLNKDGIKRDMILMTEKYDNPVFGLSASMATNVIVDELYDIIGDKATMIDFGSIWNPFVNDNIRSYHNEYKTKTLKG